MTNNFKRNLQEAITYRKQGTLPNVVLIITLTTVFTLGYILLALVLVPEDGLPEHHFATERGMITVLSAIYLAMACAFSLASLTILIRDKDKYVWSWVILAIGFAFLSLDELLQFHERIGHFLYYRADSGIFRNWNDVVVIVYGVIALPIMVIILPSLIRFRLVLELFTVAFLFYVTHTLIDSTSDPRTTMSQIMEESCKLFAGEFLMVGAFIGFLAILWNSAPLKKT